MRKIKKKLIVDAVYDLCSKANFELPKDILKSLKKNIVLENGLSKDILKEIIDNANIAKKKKIPLCQDTGVANFFVEFGINVFIENGSIYNAINKGFYFGYRNNYFRKSIFFDPINRKHVSKNIYCTTYVDFVYGDKIKINFLAKGAGSENASKVRMFIPSSNIIDIKKFILNVVNESRNSCPPLIIGIGIGGDFSSVCLLAKKALFRKIGSKNKSYFYDNFEKELLYEINKLNIGPMGIGGKTTALAVFIEKKPTHISSLPVAINIQCHSCRRMSVTI
jgi:fumarate hydratase subunit alpha